MSQPDELRKQARALLDKAKTAEEPDEGLIDVLRAMEFEDMAEDAERRELGTREPDDS